MANENQGQFVRKRDSLSAREVEDRLGQRLLEQFREDNPKHTNKHLARALDITPDAAAKVLQRGRLRLGYALVLMATAAPDLWKAIILAGQRPDAQGTSTTDEDINETT